MRKYFFKNNLHYWLFLSVALFVVSCSNEDTPVNPDEEISGQLRTDQSGSTIVNTGKIVIGTDSSDFVFFRGASVLKPEGWKRKKVLECAAMVSITLEKGDNGYLEDTTKIVDNTTIINRGTIEIHTKKMVELYERFIYNPEDSSEQDNKSEYLRMFGLYATGSNCTLINEGLIDVYFDHDPNTPIWVYCFAIGAGDGCQMINRGTIRFRGNGSRRTRMRGIGMMANNGIGINDGTMDIDVECAEDSRMITCGSDYCEIVNNGIMKGRAPGTLLGMTHYGANTITNNNRIDLTSIAMPDGQKSVLVDDSKVVCAFYEAFNPYRLDIPPLVNKGNITIRIEGSANTDACFQGYGMMFDMIGACEKRVSIVNEGSITTSQSGPVHYDMAEVGFICREGTKNAPCCVSLQPWNTTLRDFNKTHDLFLAKGVDMDFSAGNIRLSKGEGYIDGTSYSVAPEDLMYDAGQGHFIYKYSGYDQLVFSAANDWTAISWDKEKKTVSLTNK
jgi:hypothetical protein